MYKKFYSILIVLVVLTTGLLAQFHMTSGTYVCVTSNTNVYLDNGFKSYNATLDNNGVIEVVNDFENNTTSLMTSNSTGIILFKGSVSQEITGNYDVGFYGNVIIDNINGVSLTNTSTGSNQTINDSLKFVAGSLFLNNFNLTLGVNDASGVSQTSYIVTNSIGKLKRSVPADGSTVVPFPIGNSGYNPISITGSVLATSDVFSVRVVDSKPGLFPVSDHTVNRSWLVSEDVSGGSDYEVVLQWSLGDEDVSFDRTSCNVGITTDDGITTQWAAQGAASGTDPFTKDGDPFSTDGTLFVADYFHSGRVLNLDFILGGAFDGSTMSTDINQFIPLVDPFGLNISVPSVPLNAVDWVRIDLRDQNDMINILQSFAFFVNSAGNLLDLDGSIGAKITGSDVPNYISINHRNHLQIISSSLIDFGVDNPTYNFITGQSMAWQNSSIVDNYAMKEHSGSYVMWPGDINGDGQVIYTGANSDKQSILDYVGVSTPGNVELGLYSDLDVNFDGNVIYNGTNSDRAFILYQTGYNTPGLILYEHIP